MNGVSWGAYGLGTLDAWDRITDGQEAAEARAEAEADRWLARPHRPVPDEHESICSLCWRYLRSHP